MDHDAAVKELSDMVQATVTPPVLTSAQVVAALDRAVVPDLAGVMPDADGWVPSWDLEWAAAALCDLRAALATSGPQAPKQVTSEGTTITMPDPVDWSGAAAKWRAQSKLWLQLYGGGYGFDSFAQPDEPYVPTSEAIDTGVWQ